MDAFIPEAEPMVISLRAYAEPPRKQWGGDGKTRRGPPRVAPPSSWVLVFDTETTTDASQALRFGSYQVRHGGELIEAGLFHDPATLGRRDLNVLTAFAKAQSLALITRDQFIERVFYGVGYELRATFVGFNLPFDISRLAIGHTSARLDMRGGFSFKLSADKRRPHVQIKHLSQRTSLVRFAAPFRNRKARSERRRKDDKPIRRGYFVDLKTFAAALFSRSFTLGNLSEFLKVAHGKIETEEHGKALTRTYIAYAVRDAEATWDCYAALADRYRTLGLTNTPPHLIYSEASIGKAYLAAMNIRPWREVQPDAPSEIVATALSAYFGGRSEVRIRRELRQVILCDFLSMYPTVNALMRLWSFVIAERMVWREATEEIRAFLGGVTLTDLQRPETWPKLHALVQIEPCADILPVRAPYGGDGQATIGLNFLTSDRPIWFTLADAIASKLLTGRAPKVVRAIVFEPGAPQSALAAVPIAGNVAYSVDPSREDFFRRLIELRQATKGRRNKASGQERDALDAEQNALKIAANATSYGIFAETNVKERAKRGDVVVHSAIADPYTVESLNDEEPGKYFHPLLAALITGAARLMLAIAERLLTDEGLEWAFCDTDSMAIAKPDAMDATEFGIRANRVVAWFDALNPYEFGGSILKVEDVNFAVGGDGEREPLFCWAVSAKRYALFNLDTANRPIMRKASAHGLGHLRPPYDAANPAKTMPVPSVKLSNLGVDLWQHDAWWSIAVAALDGHPDQVDFDYHPALRGRAVSRYGATTPRLLGWVAGYNLNLPYERQIRPFGFLLCPLADPNYAPDPLGTVITDERSRKRRSRRPLRPIAPFHKDPAIAVRSSFDRETGEPIPAEALKTYSAALAPYPLHPESKFLDAECLDRGVTRRRHIRAIGVRLIGKEANRWEEQFFTGLDEEAQPDYGSAPEDIEARLEALRLAASSHSLTALARQAGIPVGLARRVLREGRSPTRQVIERLSQAAAELEREDAEHAELCSKLVERASRQRNAEGLAALSRRIGVDPHNLAKVLNDHRRPSQALITKLLTTLS